MEKLYLKDTVVIVEGKYDKIKLSSVIDATILTTDGFAVFNNEEKKCLIRRLSQDKTIVILTDSDKAGFVIRNKIKGMVKGKSKIINLYSPKISGKESRKKAMSKEGLLGVEGVEAKSLRDMFVMAGFTHSQKKHVKESLYSKADLYALGYSGKDDSKSKRDRVLSKNSLPEGMSANAFLEVVNLLGITLD